MLPVVFQDGALRLNFSSVLVVSQMQNLGLELSDFFDQLFVHLVDLLMLALLKVVVLLELVPLLAQLRYFVGICVDNLGVIPFKTAAAVDSLQ